MKKVLSLLVVGGMLAVAACGPSEAEKKAAEQKKLDSIAAVEKVKLDSLAALAAQAAQEAADAEAAAKEAKAELKDAKADAKAAKADAAAAQRKADLQKVEVKKEAAVKENGGKLLNKTGGTQNGQEVKPADKGGKLKNKMN